MITSWPIICYTDLNRTIPNYRRSSTWVTCRSHQCIFQTPSIDPEYTIQIPRNARNETGTWKNSSNFIIFGVNRTCESKHFYSIQSKCELMRRDEMKCICVHISFENTTLNKNEGNTTQLFFYIVFDAMNSSNPHMSRIPKKLQEIRSKSMQMRKPSPEAFHACTPWLGKTRAGEQSTEWPRVAAIIAAGSQLLWRAVFLERETTLIARRTRVRCPRADTRRVVFGAAGVLHKSGTDTFSSSCLRACFFSSSFFASLDIRLARFVC